MTASDEARIMVEDSVIFSGDPDDVQEFFDELTGQVEHGMSHAEFVEMNEKAMGMSLKGKTAEFWQGEARKDSRAI